MGGRWRGAAGLPAEGVAVRHPQALSAQYLFDDVAHAALAAGVLADVARQRAYLGRGVSGCATCDGAFFRGKEVAVVGGGDVACEDALFLARLCSKVWLIHRRDALRASKVMADRVLASAVIEPIWDTVVDDVLDPAAGTVTAVRLRNVKDGSLRDLPISGLFVAIGHTPNTVFLKGAVDLDPRGYVAVRDGVRTSAEGVFAAGDVMDPDYKQAVIAAGAGAKAALEAERYLLG